MKKSCIWLNSCDSYTLYKDDALSFYEENSDYCKVNRVVLWRSSFKIWDI